MSPWVTRNPDPAPVTAPPQLLRRAARSHETAIDQTPPCSHTAAWPRSSSLIGGVSSSACGKVTSVGKNRVDLVEQHVSLLLRDDDQLVDGFVLLRTPQRGTAVCVRMDVSLRCYHHDRDQDRPGVPIGEVPVGGEGGRIRDLPRSSEQKIVCRRDPENWTREEVLPLTV